MREPSSLLRFLIHILLFFSIVFFSSFGVDSWLLFIFSSPKTRKKRLNESSVMWKNTEEDERKRERSRRGASLRRPGGGEIQGLLQASCWLSDTPVVGPLFNRRPVGPTGQPVRCGTEDSDFSRDEFRSVELTRAIDLRNHCRLRLTPLITSPTLHGDV